MRDYFSVGQTLSTRIRSIDLQRMRADLIADKRDILDRRRWEIPPVSDHYLVVLPEDEEALHGRGQLMTHVGNMAPLR